MQKEHASKLPQLDIQADPISIPKAKAKSKTKAKTNVKDKIKVKPKLKKMPLKAKSEPVAIQIPFESMSPSNILEESPRIEGYALTAEQSALISTDEFESFKKAQLTAQELLDKPLEELEKDIGKREAQNLVKNMRILTAIMLGKNKNKELAHVLNTDKSFTSKQIKDLEERGLVKREGDGKETTYSVDRFNVMKFLESKVVIKWGKGKPKETDALKREENGRKKDD